MTKEELAYLGDEVVGEEATTVVGANVVEYENSKADTQKASLVYAACMVGSGIAGSVLWKKHPFWGGVVGLFFAGPVVGTLGAGIYGKVKGMRF